MGVDLVYAIIRSGGKQYRVSEGDTITVERLSTEVGEKVTLSEVLFVGDGDTFHVGAPLLSSASVVGTVVAHDRSRKIRVVKLKKRKHYRRTKGHRQSITRLRIDGISAS
jgi:large subunit ribosomal protein L21